MSIWWRNMHVSETGGRAVHVHMCGVLHIKSCCDVGLLQRPNLQDIDSIDACSKGRITLTGTLSGPLIGVFVLTRTSDKDDVWNRQLIYLSYPEK